MTAIIIADWAGYPLLRNKIIKRKKIKCGIKRILDAFNTHKTDSYFQCILVINAAEKEGNSLLKWPFFSRKNNTQETYLKLARHYPFISKVIFRDNSGMDIGAYNTGLQYLRRSEYKGDVVFMNSSVAPPHQANWLEKYKQLLYQSPKIGACGITMNSHNTCLNPAQFMPHIQSFFIYSNMDILMKVFPKGVYNKKDDNSLSTGKDSLVEQYEIGFSQQLLKAQYGITCSSFPKFTYFKGNDWNIPEGDIRFKKEYTNLANKI